MIDLSLNPVIGDPSLFTTIQFYQTRETLMDTEEYTRFVYSIENQFRRSRFYKDYKCGIMQLGLSFDQQMKGITSEMADIELHHHLPTLKDATIVITEHFLNTTGKVCTFDVIQALEGAHRQNMMGIIMLSSTIHQAYESDPTAFISISQLYGNPFAFLEAYGRSFTMEVAFKWLLQFKQEEQYGNKTHWPGIAKARDQLLDWHNSGYIRY